VGSSTATSAPADSTGGGGSEVPISALPEQPTMRTTADEIAIKTLVNLFMARSP
jgi:hypothetical protein